MSFNAVEIKSFLLLLKTNILKEKYVKWNQR